MAGLKTVSELAVSVVYPIKKASFDLPSFFQRMPSKRFKYTSDVRKTFLASRLEC